MRSVHVGSVSPAPDAAPPGRARPWRGLAVSPAVGPYCAGTDGQRAPTAAAPVEPWRTECPRPPSSTSQRFAPVVSPLSTRPTRDIPGAMGNWSGKKKPKRKRKPIEKKSTTDTPRSGPPAASETSASSSPDAATTSRTDQRGSTQAARAATGLRDRAQLLADRFHALPMTYRLAVVAAVVVGLGALVYRYALNPEPSQPASPVAVPDIPPAPTAPAPPAALSAAIASAVVLPSAVPPPPASSPPPAPAVSATPPAASPAPVRVVTPSASAPLTPPPAPKPPAAPKPTSDENPY